MFGSRKKIVRLKQERDEYKKVANMFAEACRLDGFGDVHETHNGDLTEAYADLQILNFKYGEKK